MVSPGSVAVAAAPSFDSAPEEPVNYYKAPVFGMTPNEVTNAVGQAYQNATEKNRGLLLGQELRFNALTNPDRAMKIAEERIGAHLENLKRLDELDPKSDKARLARAQADNEELVLKEAMTALPSKTREQLYTEISAKAKATYAGRYEKAQAEGAEARSQLTRELIPSKLAKSEADATTAASKSKSALIAAGVDEATADEMVAIQEQKLKKASADASKAESEAEVSAATVGPRVQKALADGDFSAARADIEKLKAANYPDYLKVTTEVARKRSDKLDEEIKVLQAKPKLSAEDAQKMADLKMESLRLTVQGKEADLEAKKIKELKVGPLLDASQQKVINGIKDLAARSTGFDKYMDAGNPAKSATYKAQVEAEAKKMVAQGILNEKLYPLVTGKAYTGAKPTTPVPEPRGVAYQPPEGAQAGTITLGTGAMIRGYSLPDGTTVDLKGNVVK